MLKRMPLKLYEPHPYRHRPCRRAPAYRVCPLRDFWGAFCAHAPVALWPILTHNYNQMKEYLICAVAGKRVLQSWFKAETEKQARKAFWESLDADFRDVCESMEVIDEREPMSHPYFER